MRERVVRMPGGTMIWRVGVAVIGFAVVAIGVVFLFIPGPGWLIIFLGMGIWASEFAWARALLKFARRYVGLWTLWVGRQRRVVAVLIGVAVLFVVAVAVVVTWLIFR